MLQMKILGGSPGFSCGFPIIKISWLTLFLFPSRVGRVRGRHEGTIIQYIKYACKCIYIYKEKEKKRAKKLQIHEPITTDFPPPSFSFIVQNRP